MAELLETVIAEVRREVEEVLQTRFAREHPEDQYRNHVSEKVRSWRDVLSTDPQSVRPERYYLFSALNKGNPAQAFSDCIRGECHTIPPEIGICLLEAGIEVQHGLNRASPSRVATSHNYLVIPRMGFEVLVDPTIAQMVQGHDHVFVGTRKQLRKLILHGIVPGGAYRLRTDYLRDKTEESFEVHWGNLAQVIPFRLQSFFQDVSKMKTESLKGMK